MEKGQKAINFSLKDQMNMTIRLSDFIGHKVFLFFFSEVNSLNDQVHMINVAKEFTHFQQYHVSVLGVCGSTVEQIIQQSHRLYIPYYLLSDADANVRKAYGVWKQKMTFGKPYWITARTSLLIDETGIVYKVYRRAAVDTNAQEVVAFLQHQYEKDEWRKLPRRTKERLRRQHTIDASVNQTKKTHP